jgi:hypothetical protein
MIAIDRRARGGPRRVANLSAAAAAALVLVSACGSAMNLPASDGGRTCASRRLDAEAEVQRTIDANAACSVDSDCAVVEFATACFDACTRPVNAGGVAAVGRSIDAVNAGDCATYARDCGAVVHPPCDPRVTPPLCHIGRCE